MNVNVFKYTKHKKSTGSVEERGKTSFCSLRLCCQLVISDEVNVCETAD